MNNDKMKNMAKIFKSLSHPTRVKIIACLLLNQNSNVNQISECIKIRQSTTSQHLSILKMNGIIEVYRNANQNFYKVINKDVIELFKLI